MTEAINTTTSTVRTADGLTLSTAMHLPPRPPKASVMLVHGVGEYSGRYAHVVADLVARDYAVFTLDHRGHGRSEGPRTMVRDMSQAAADLERVFEAVRGEYPGLKFFVLGHSMGSLISLLFVLNRQAELDGWITSGSPLTVDETSNALEMALARRLRNVLGWLRLKPIGPELTCRDSDVFRAYQSDPLVDQRPVPLATSIAIADGAIAARERLHELRLPVLILHGEADELTPISASRLLYEKAGSPDKLLKTYADMKHEILNDPERHLVLNDLADWLAARL